MAGEKILVADDEQSIRLALRMAFQREGMNVSEAVSGKEVLELLSKDTYDLLVLDLMMDQIDGLTVLQTVRSSGNMIPILILSGKQEEADQVLGLGLGADDYLTKPFHISILTQKVKALIRRNSIYSQKTKENRLVCGSFTLDLLRQECYKNGQLIPFTPKELTLFHFFLENPNQVFSKEQLYRQVWSEHFVDDNTVMVFMKRIRSKIEEDPKNPQFLRTIRGVGYIFGGF